MYLYNLLISDAMNALRTAISIVTLVIMALAALATIILILLQPSNSSGVSALGGSSETFFGKNKGKSIEAKMKKWTIICLVILLVFSVIYFVVPYNTAIWGA
ncbi:MAG: preprotein translocase subunit SecG [Clostridia bacterium]|nr:preprotein translocase subunit SecG [Clostridia bacterium]